jgi:hypothetical protein
LGDVEWRRRYKRRNGYGLVNRGMSRTPPITVAATTGRPRRLRGLADAGADEPGRHAGPGNVGDQLASPLDRRVLERAKWSHTVTETGPGQLGVDAHQQDAGLISHWRVTNALAGPYPGRRAQRYRLEEERAER